MSQDSRDGVITTKQQFLVMSRMSFHWGGPGWAGGGGGGGGGGGDLSREIIFRLVEPVSDRHSVDAGVRTFCIFPIPPFLAAIQSEYALII